MKAIHFFACSLLLSFLISSETKAQNPVVIDYTSVNLSGCNAFASSPSVSGFVHSTNVGSPYHSGGKIMMTATWSGSSPLCTKYQITFPLAAGHSYDIKVTLDVANNYSPELNVGPQSAPPASNSNCNGPAALFSSPAGGWQPVHSPGFYMYRIDMPAGVSGNVVEVITRPGSSTMGTATLQEFGIEKIEIKDVTPPLPTFTMTSSATVKRCASQGLDPITFTINNVDNASGVTGYTFIVEAGKWLMNGAPAGPTIATASNSITLTPVICSPKTTVYGKANIGSTIVNAGSQLIAVRNPIYAISDPTVSSSSFATSAPVVAPNLPLYLPCPSPISWTVSDLQIATVSTNAGATSATVTRNGRGPDQGIVTLTATMNLCGESVTASRSVQVTPFGVMSGTIKLDGLLPGNEGISGKLITGVSPNPTTGLFVVDLGREVSGADMLVMDINGKPVQKRKVSGAKIQVDLSAAAGGMYFVKIGDSADGGMAKIVKR